VHPNISFILVYIFNNNIFHYRTYIIMKVLAVIMITMIVISALGKSNFLYTTKTLRWFFMLKTTKQIN